MLLVAAVLNFPILGQVRAVSPIPPLVYQSRVLPNGLRYIFSEDHRTPTVAIQVWYHVGSKDDPEGRSGFAHLFEHMMFKSTARMPSEFFDRLTEDIGGENNAYTGNDATVYHETIPANHLQRLLWAEAERLAALTVDVRNFTLEREVVKEEYRQRVLADPYGEFGEFIEKKSFAVHPYRCPTIGNIAELDAATLEEVRAFHATFYRPDNAVVAIVGDFSPADLERWMSAYFGAITTPGVPLPRVTAHEPDRAGPRLIEETDPKVPLPALAQTYLGPAVTAAEAVVWRVLEKVLSGGDSSRLYRHLIYEQQLAQSAEFSADLRADLGLLDFRMILARDVSLKKASAALQHEIRLLQEKPISESELRIAKNQLLATALSERETCEGRAAALAEAVAIYQDPERVNTDLAACQAVTSAQIQAAARHWFTPKNRLEIHYLPGVKKVASASPR